MKKILGFLIVCLFSTATMAAVCPPGRSDYFCITPEMAPDSPVKIFDFYSIPVKVISLFNKELTRVKDPVVLDAQWESPYFGAGISYYNDQFKMMILGGTTRIEGMSLDAYAAIVCHELGHIVGGAPLQTIPGAEWSSSEGQADFFAGSVCLPRYFSSLGEPAQNINSRVEKAGFEMLNSLRHFDSNSEGEARKLIRHAINVTKAKETLINLYPTIQCRYENFRNNTKRASCWFKE